MRWFSTLLALLVVALFGGFYFRTYQRESTYLTERNLRVVAMAAQALEIDTDAAKEIRKGATARFEFQENLLVIQEGGDAPKPRLARLLNQFARPDFFDGTLVADETLGVQRQWPSRGKVPRIASLAELKPTGDTLKKGELKPEALAAAAGVFDVEVQAVPYKLFLSSVQLPVAWAEKEGAGRAKVIVGGLVSADRFRREAMSVPPLVVSAAIGLLLLVVLALPFLKVAMLTRLERLRFGDTLEVAVCMLLGLLVLTLGPLTLGLALQVDGQVDARLRRVADAITASSSRSLKTELNELCRRLGGIDALHARLPSASGATDCWRMRAAAQCSPTGSPSPEAVQAFKTWPGLDSAFWLSKDGDQMVKWQSREMEPRIPVGSRDYFEAMRSKRDGDTPPRPDSMTSPDCLGKPKDPACQFFLDFVRSKVNGQVRTVLALAAKGRTGDQGPDVIAASLTRLASLSSALPAGAGFCIVTPRGWVVFHSDAAQAQTHSLVTETQNDEQVKAALASGAASGDLNVRYWGAPHRFRIQPLGVGRWALVVFQDMTALEALELDAVESALALSLFMALAALVLPALVYLLISGRQIAWLWTRRERVRLYAHLALCLCALGALYGWLLWSRRPSLLAGLSLPVAGLVACLFVGLRLRRLGTSGLQREPTSTPRLVAWIALCAILLFWRFDAHPLGVLALGIAIAAVVLALGQIASKLTPGRSAASFAKRHPTTAAAVAGVAFWAVVAVLPTIGFFKAAAERAGRDWVRYDLLHHARALGTPDDDARTYGLPANAFGITPTSPPGPGSPQAGYVWEVTAHDMEGRVSSALQRLPRLTPRTSLVREGEGRGSFVVLEDAMVYTLGEQGWRSSLWNPFARLGAWIWLALVLTSAAAVGLARWASGALLAEDPGSARVVDLESVALGTRSQLVVVASVFEARDLETLASIPGPDGPLVLWPAPYEEADAARRGTLLGSIADARRTGRRALIVTTSLPTRTLDSASRSTTTGWAAGESARWLDLLRGYDLVIARAAAPAISTVRSVARRLAGGDGRIEALLAGECLVSRYVLELVERLPDRSLARLTGPECLERLQEAAWSYYLALWSSCSPEERLTLVQLAEEGFVNPRRRDVLRALLDKGLVRFGPILSLLNRSFRGFVLAVRREADVEGLEKSVAPRLSWADLRPAVLCLAAAVGFIVANTQEAMFDSLLVFGSTFATVGVPSLGGLLALLQKVRMADTGPRPGPPRA